MAMKALALYIAAVGTAFPALAFNSTCYNPPFQGGGSEGHVAAGDTPCSPSTDVDKARACCGYSDGSICLSNGLCFVPLNNSMLQGSCTDPSWTSPGCPDTKCVDANLQFCRSAPEDIPTPGDSEGLWYCKTSSQNCADAKSVFGIQQGHFADFRNYSSTSSAAATSSKSIPASTSADVTNSASCNAPATTTETLSTRDSSCPSSTGGDKIFSPGAIAGAVIGSFGAGLIASGAGIWISRCRRGGKHQTTVIRKDDETQRRLERGPLPELPTNRSRGAELP